MERGAVTTGKAWRLREFRAVFRRPCQCSSPIATAPRFGSGGLIDVPLDCRSKDAKLETDKAQSRGPPRTHFRFRDVNHLSQVASDESVEKLPKARHVILQLGTPSRLAATWRRGRLGSCFRAGYHRTWILVLPPPK